MGCRIPDRKKPAAGFDAYFQGYIPVTLPKKNGKGVRTVRIYTAPYRVHDMYDREYVLHKCEVAGLTALAAACYLWAALTRTACNANPLTAFPGGLSLAALLFEVIAAGSYVVCPRKMTIYQADHSHGSLMRWNLLSCILLTATAAACAVHGFSNGDLGVSLWVAARYLLSAAAAGLLYRREGLVLYAEEENVTVIPNEI